VKLLKIVLLSTTLMMSATFGATDLPAEDAVAAVAPAQKQTSAQLLTESAGKLDKSNKNLRTVMDATKATVEESSKLLGISLDGVSASLTKSILPAFLDAVRGVSASTNAELERLQGLEAQVAQLTQEKEAAAQATERAAAEKVSSQATIEELRANLEKVRKLKAALAAKKAEEEAAAAAALEARKAEEEAAAAAALAAEKAKEEAAAAAALAAEKAEEEAAAEGLLAAMAEADALDADI
jgi:hypothetical protein